MASLSESESLLLAKLENATPSASTPLLPLFSSHLLPFSSLTTNISTAQNTLTLTRSLAKQFLPFINRCLSVLPKRLSNPQCLQSSAADSAESSKFAIDLFDIYRLCLDCLELVSSQLSCKPWTVYIQRVRLVYCLEAYRFYKEGEVEGFRVLEKIKGLDLGGEKKKTKKKAKDEEEKLGEFLPHVMDNVDAELARLVVEVVDGIVKCVVLRGSKNDGDYKRVIGLVAELTPWFRKLDADAYEKLHRVLVTYLGKGLLFLVGELVSFDGNMVRAFCVMTLDEYTKSSMKDQVFKYACRICSSLSLLQDDRPYMVIDMLMCVFYSLAQKCKVEIESWGTEFVELVSYCACKCRTASTNFCSAIAERLNKLAGDFCQVLTPLDLILRLYAIGLSFRDCVVKSRAGDVAPSKGAQEEPVPSFWLDEITLSNFGTVLGSLRSYFYGGCKVNGVSCTIECKGSPSHICSQLDYHHEMSVTFVHKNRKVYLLSYLNALKFLCQPLADLVNSQKKQIVSESDATPAPAVLCSLHEAFHQFCDISLHFHSTTSEGVGFDESKMIVSVAVAAFILSIRTKHEFQKAVHLIKQIIASKWIQPHGLKYIFASLYNVGVLLYRNKHTDEASKALKLCCKASWTCVILLCEMLMHNSSGLVGDFSEDAVLDFITEACTRTAFLLDVLDQCDSLKVRKVVVNSLNKWSIAEDLVRRLPGPMPLVKQWVKIGCKLNKNLGTSNNAPTLYCLLSSSVRVSKRAISKILQQELLAYEELDSMYPELCQRMEMKIIDILLKDVYVTHDSYLERARILIRKGWALRAYPLEGLRSCVQCLTEAISAIKDEISSCGTPACHQLAVAYCLRALSTQEAEPNSKQIFQDIKDALNLWLSIPISGYGAAFDEGSMLPDSAMLLLYNVVDLLSMKGSVEFHCDIYKLMIRLFKWKNVQLDKCLSILWESRRLSHALCVSPVIDAFTMSLSGDSGEQLKSIDSWMHCLEGCTTSIIGFRQNFSNLCANFCSGSHNHETSFWSDCTVGNIKEAAFELISTVPVTSCSVFFAGYLYYDLSERLIASGHLFEALSYAKEAHRFRTKLFQEQFTYSVEKQGEKRIEVGDSIQKLTYGLRNLHLHRSSTKELWFDGTISWDVEACYLSTWKVLQCYLESTLQVGTIHEIIGNGVEAETFLLWGKDISCLQSLPLFIVSYSSALGKLYRKKQAWELSEKELQIAKQLLANSSTTSFCLKCRLMHEITVDQELGDLCRSCVSNATEHDSIDRLSEAESIYKSALNKLNISEWKNCVSCPEKVEGNAFACSATSQQDAMSFGSTKMELKAKMETRNCKKTKSALKSPLNGGRAAEHNTRLTRSRYRSQNQNVNRCAETQIACSNQLKGKDMCALSDTANQRESLLEANSCAVVIGCEKTCVCTKVRCWFCLATEVKESGSLSNFMLMKWEYVRRRLSLRILSGIAKCIEVRGKIHEIHETLLQSILVLVSRNTFSHVYAPVPLTFLLDLVGKDLPEDAFAVERASILYDLCWFCLKNYHARDASNRTFCCDLSQVQLPKIVSCLMLAFVLCREVPTLFQKVSRLLSSIYVFSSSSEIFSLPCHSKELSESHWASYFHQASLGTHLNYQFFSNMTSKSKAQQLVDDRGLHVPGSIPARVDTGNLPRLAPNSRQDLEQFVMDFFSDLPCTTVICISLIGGSLAKLLQELLLYPSCVSAWMLLSRLSFKSQPFVMLLPVHSIFEEEDDTEKPGSGEFSGSNDLNKHWHCPWGSTVVDDVAPVFKLILEENYLSSSISPLEDTKSNRMLWWMRRKKLDYRLSNLLRKMEDSWFGPWRCVLLGERLNCAHLDSILTKLVRDLKSRCKLEINESFLKAILEGAKCKLDREAAISHLSSLKKGCFIGKAGYYDEQWCETLSEGIEKLIGLASQLISEAVNELEEEDTTREPVILVLDCEVQMLPWENLPMLRNQEVYRMPSVGSIQLTLGRSHHNQAQVGRIVAAFPFIDPLDAFYLLNPSGDLSSTQIEFENWFRDQNFEGKAGSAPTPAELALALKSHDLFIYFGHGSGAQYISQQEIQKLENCAATLLMGCSSGSLSLNGSYIPQGTPLSYLLAGSPVIVANLWEVTDKDIDRFGKAMLDAWLSERSNASVNCTGCNLLAEEFGAINVRSVKGNSKKKIPKKRPEEVCDGECLKYCFDQRPRIGSFMGQAREACTLPFLIGASPVCYGVPTGIRRKKDL